MKKVSIILVTLFAVVGAILIYKFTDTEEHKNASVTKISNEYNMLDQNNIYKYQSIDEIYNTISEKTGIIFFCIPENDWCNYYAKYLNDIVKSNNINEIYYLNIKQDRSYNSNSYGKIVNKLKDYLLLDDEGNKKIFTPISIFVKNGNVIDVDSDTNYLSNKLTPSEYYNEEKINEFNERINNILIKYKEEL